MLAKELSRQGVKVALIVFGLPSELPAELAGVTIIPRPPYKKRPRFTGKVIEGLEIWRALWRTPARAIVYRGSGVEVGLSAVYARLTGRRLVFSSANVVDFSCELFLRRSDRMIYRLGVRLAHKLVVQTSEQVALCESAFGRRPIVINSLQPVREPQGESPEAFIWIGRLVSYKRPLEYLALARALPEAKFWMVGVPTPHHASDQFVIDAVYAEAPQIANLVLISPRAHGELQRLVARAVASVNTADVEGMPNVLLEAWSCGVPALVLTHDPGGVVATHGLGEFADGSLTRFIDLAREQWNARNDRQAASQRCRAYVAHHHSPERVAEQWRRVLCPSSTCGVTPPAPEGDITCAG
jgi:glycosyltransferase involved in cell wall biosynthesis